MLLKILVVIGTDFTGSCKSKYHTITTTAPLSPFYTNCLNAITITPKKVAHDILIITRIPMYKDELINSDENKCC
jgi:hypothetical protein